MDLQMMIRQRGLKQSWIAEQIGVREPELSLMVRGRKPVPDAVASALAKLLKVRVRDICSAKEPVA